MRTHLPAELTSLVHEISDLWGETILEETTPQLFRKVESLREFLKKFRKPKSSTETIPLLKKLQKKTDSLRPVELVQITHAFSVLLELTNICENAVRSQKIRHGQKIQTNAETKNEVYLVLTAHPTESRAPDVVETLNDIQKIVTTGLFENNLQHLESAKPYMRRLWHLRMAKQEKPEVKDEANYLFSILFKPETVENFLKPIGEKLFLRTWVGGDKDGHPGVDEKVMLESLQGSRSQILKVLRQLICLLEQELTGYIHLSQGDLADPSQKACARMANLKRKLSALEIVRAKDADRVQKFKESFEQFKKSISPKLEKSLITLPKIIRLLDMFPYLVIPLELREDSSVFRDLEGLKQKPAIYRMLRQLADLTGKHDPRGYARALIISMCESLDDLKAAEIFQNKAFKNRPGYPIVPLFEKSKDLRNGPQIVDEWLKLKKLKKFEVMLGYSDSSKEGGVLPSRIAIRNAIAKFEALSHKHKGLALTYFHGSGGSVDRGGGAIENQTAHWPQQAFDRFKVTLQGEMIQRTFSTPEIFEQYLSKIRTLSAKKKRKAINKTSPTLEAFTKEITNFYRRSVSDPNFLQMVEKASAYRFLEQLRLGSRPTKRKALEGVGSLRAIPWILAWTQTRTLLPTWWGFGTAYSLMKAKQKAELKKLARGEDPLFASYMQQLGFTLAKIEPAIWHMYLQRSSLPPKEKKRFFEDFELELMKTQKAFRDLTGHKDFLWFKPWLQESIRLRAPLIHPLNLAQLKAWKVGHAGLLREASVGIACGMLTTG